MIKSASTQRGFSLTQVAALSREMGLDFQMAFRGGGAAFVVPSVIHWKVGHYAAIIRREGDRFLLQDPTFRNDVWATSAALEREAQPAAAARGRARRARRRMRERMPAAAPPEKPPARPAGAGGYLGGFDLSCWSACCAWAAAGVPGAAAMSLFQAFSASAAFFRSCA